MALTFRDNQFPVLRLDDNGKSSRLLSKQYKGYKNKDKPPKQQKALPLCVIRQLTKNKATERAKAIGDLAITAFFFAMRSCEYLKVSCKAEDRKTKQLRSRNIRFFRNDQELKHSDPTLIAADYVSVTFEDQKNDTRQDTITMQHSGDNLLCPVRSLARIITRIRSYPESSDDLHINTFRSRSSLHQVTGDDMKLALRAAAAVIGEDKLGFKSSEIGTHSIRSGAAMAMYLDEVPVYTIMLIGRWSSDAFLLYIQKQIEQFSHNVSRRMINRQFFMHIPTIAPRVSHLDPRQRNCRDNFQTRRNMGSGLNSLIPTLPQMSL